MENKNANSASIIAKPAAGITPDQARDTRARAWAFIFNCHAKKNAAGVTSTDGDDAKKGSLKHEVRANTSIPYPLDRKPG